MDSSLSRRQPRQHPPQRIHRHPSQHGREAQRQQPDRPRPPPLQRPQPVPQPGREPHRDGDERREQIAPLMLHERQVIEDEEGESEEEGGAKDKDMEEPTTADGRPPTAAITRTKQSVGGGQPSVVGGLKEDSS